MKKRILVLPLSALAITAMCVYASLRVHDAATDPVDDSWKLRAPVVSQADPSAQLTDSDNKLIRLQSYLGRHRIVLVFVDDSLAFPQNETLRLLKDNFSALHKNDVKIVAIGSLIPQRNRKNLETYPLPFPVVTDLEPRFLWHRLWKRFDEKNDKPLPGTFYIDRAGDVDWNDSGPIPIDNLNELIRQLKNGKH